MTQVSARTRGASTDMEPGKHGMRLYFGVEEVKEGAACATELGGDAGDPRPVPGWIAIRRDQRGTDSGPWQNDPSVPHPSA